jgi:serine/threonine protein kinase
MSDPLSTLAPEPKPGPSSLSTGDGLATSAAANTAPPPDLATLALPLVAPAVVDPQATPSPIPAVTDPQATLSPIPAVTDPNATLPPGSAVNDPNATPSPIPAFNDPNATLPPSRPEPAMLETAAMATAAFVRSADREAAGKAVGVGLGDGSAAARILNLGRPEIPGFEILNELGRGGMGVVYRARQRSANRIVALKVVRNDVLEALPHETRVSTLDRFRSEAEAAANLDHDNLVTVFEVGEANGVCYYAMRYVEGRSLHDLLKDGPLDQRAAAGYLEPVTRALSLAHERGILHRDLKPHNIMVDRRTNRPLLADFGLAKFMGKSQEITHAGEILGTPSYMPPEQTVDSASVTGAADIYSMGATLYHLLTGRPPFQAASLLETIRQITTQEPVAPRQFNPSLDRDLETICLKCLQKEPGRRYAAAADLADDLRRYLEGRPIVARPLNWVERSWRWCRRNPVPAAWISVAASFALVSILAILIGYIRTAAALAESRRHLAQTVGAVNDLFTRFSEDDLKDEPGMQPLRVELLGRAKEHLKTLLSESEDDPLLRDYVAEARFLVGVAQMEDESQRESALAELSEAVRMQRLLRDEPTDDLNRRRNRIKSLSTALTALASFRLTEARGLAVGAAAAEAAEANARWAAVDGRCDEAESLYREAKQLRETLAELSAGGNAPAKQHAEPASDAESTAVEATRLLASAVMNLGIFAENRSQIADRRGDVQTGAARRREAAERYAEAQRLRLRAKEQLRIEANAAVLASKLEQDLGKGEFQLARLRLAERSPAAEEAAIGHLRSAIKHFEAFVRAAPESLANRHRLGIAYSLLGATLAERGELAAAWNALEEATRYSRALALGNPTVTDYQREVADLYVRRGLLREAKGEGNAAADEYGDAVRVLQESLRVSPASVNEASAAATSRARQDNAELERELAALRIQWAEAELNRDGWDAALAAIAAAESYWSRGAGKTLNADDRRFAQVRLAVLRGRAHWGQGNREVAEADWRDAETQLAAWRAESPADPDARLLECRTRNHLATAAGARGDWKRAIELFTASDLALAELLREFPDDPEFAELAGETLGALADALERAGRGTEAAAIQARAAAMRSTSTAPPRGNSP